MSRTRTPTAQLESSGAFVKHPERKRARAGEPKPTALLGLPPAHLKAVEKRIWDELSGKLVAGVAANSDEGAFESLVCLVGDFRMRRRKGLPQPVGEITAMIKLFSLFGMTPADRTRVSSKSGGSGKTTDEFDDWDKETSAVN